MSKFLYKIHSGYDGFRPSRIPDRLLDGDRLRLGWKAYIDNVRRGDQVWVYFYGRGNYEYGVYAKGTVREIDLINLNVYIRVNRYSVDGPLTDEATSRRVAEAVATRYQQVFLYPQEWVVAPNCTIDGSTNSCAGRLCLDCPTWQDLMVIDEEECAYPSRLTADFNDFIPAYWVVPHPCYWSNADIDPRVHRTSGVFYRFKNGEANLAYPLALGINEALRRANEVDFDGVIYIPLSPDKARAGEINRTRLLATELATLLDIPLVNGLSLNRPISKRRMRQMGYTKVDFETAYFQALEVQRNLDQFRHLLLLDDVCTHGSTLTCAARRIWNVVPDLELSAVTAGQMVVKSVVRNDGPLI